MDNCTNHKLEEKINQLDEKLSLIMEKVGVEIEVQQEKVQQEKVQQGDVRGDTLQSLQDCIGKWVAESKDPYFTQYLWSMNQKVQAEEQNIAKIVSDLNRNYKKYQQRIREMGMTAPSEPVVQEEPVLTKRQPEIPTAIDQATSETAVPKTVEIPEQIPQPVEQRSESLETVAPIRQENTKNNSTMEFKIGAGVLGAVGIFFILSAFVMFGMSFMGGMLKGICLFAISAAVLLLSECVIRKRQEKFSRSITALGICGLYLSVIINYIYLHNFNGIIAIIITILIAVAALWISRKRESTIIRVIGFLGCYTCLYPIQGFVNDKRANFLVLAGILFIINMMTALIPIRKNGKSVAVIHTCAHIIFTGLIFEAVCSSYVDSIDILIYLVSSLIVLNAIFLKQEKTEAMIALMSGSLFVECIFMWILVPMLFQGWLIPLMSLPVCVVFFVLNRKSNAKWLQYWFFLLLLYGQYGIMGRGWESVIGILIIFASAKILSRVYFLRISEAIITIVTMLVAWMTMASGDIPKSLCFVGAFLLSVGALKYWRTLHEMIITVVLLVFTWCSVEPPLSIAVSMGILFLGMLVFNQAKWWRGSKIKVYNYCNFAIMAIIYLTLIALHNYLIYIIMLLFGISTIILMFQKKYHMDFKYKHFIMALFLTYMTFVCKVKMPIVISIILMVIAIGSVATGFYHKEKYMRVYGLILALFACAKVILSYFYGAATLQKMILFFVMGIIVLAISYIYIRLEKRINKQEMEG